jgi:hypothetical protein
MTGHHPFREPASAGDEREPAEDGGLHALLRRAWDRVNRPLRRLPVPRP